MTALSPVFVGRETPWLLPLGTPPSRWEVLQGGARGVVWGSAAVVLQSHVPLTPASHPGVVWPGECVPDHA